METLHGTAERLRERMAAQEAEKLREMLAAKARQERAQHDLTEHFLNGHLDKRELALALKRIEAAAEHGAFEALVLRFPSKLCHDGGRAVNNALPEWPITLRGKAREAYVIWKRWGRPRGFGLRAEIMDFPGGMPGDVGLYVTWVPPVT